MKLSDKFILHKSGKNYTMVCVDADLFSGIIRVNKTTAEIVELLKEDTTEQDIIDAMNAKYNGAEQEVEEDVAMVIQRLRKLGALVE